MDLVKEVSRLKKELNDYKSQPENQKEVNYYKSLLGVLRSQFVKEKQHSASLIQTQKFEIERLNDKLNHCHITSANSSSEGL